MKTKRLLALLLCICMVTAILPMASATTTEDTTPTTVVADFTDTAKYDSAEATSVYVSCSYFQRIASVAVDGSNPLQVRSQMNQYGAFDIGAVSAGKYNVSFEYAKYLYGAKADVYLVAADDLGLLAGWGKDNRANTAFSAATKYQIGSVDFYSATGLAGQKLEATVELPAAKNYLLVVSVNAFNESVDTYGLGHVYVNGVTLTPVVEEDATPTTVVADFTDTAKYDSAEATSVYVSCSYFQRIASVAVDGSNPLQVRSQMNQYGAFDIGAVSAGKYNVSFEYAKYLYGAKADVYLVAADDLGLLAGWGKDNRANTAFSAATKYQIGSVDFYSATGLAGQKLEATVELPAAKNYLLVVSVNAFNESVDTYGLGHVYVNGVTLAPVTEEEPTPEPEDEVSVNFGEDYAYLTKDESGSYKLTFIGGIKEIDGYSEVGFEVNGVKIGDTAVYETLTYNGAPIEKSVFGDVDYIFGVAKDGISAGEEVTFRAYSVKGEGDSAVYEYGKSYTITVNAAN